jgi:hypothetical protein
MKVLAGTFGALFVAVISAVLVTETCAAAPEKGGLSGSVGFLFFG